MSPLLTGLTGAIPALVTPFRPGDAALDEAALARLAERVVNRGASAVVACGSTGEAPALSPHEHARVIKVVAEAVGHRVPVIAGVGAPCTETAAALAQAASLVGAAALLVSAPPYVKPTQEGLHAHVRAVSAAGGLPLMLYDVPSRAAAAFTDETIERLYTAGLIQALKDATGDLGRPLRLRGRCGQGLAQFSGDDATALAHLAMGGAGCVSVTANVTPTLCVALQNAWQARDIDRATDIARCLAPLDAALFHETNPIPVKAALGLLRLCEPTPRLPLTNAAGATRATLARVLSILMPYEDIGTGTPRRLRRKAA